MLSRFKKKKLYLHWRFSHITPAFLLKDEDAEDESSEESESEEEKV